MNHNIEMKVYAKMCRNCPYAKECHEECITCEEYEKEVNKETGRLKEK